MNNVYLAELAAVHKSYGKTVALDGLDLRRTCCLYGLHDDGRG